MSLLSTSPTCLLLPGRAFLRHGGRILEERRGEGWDGALASLEALPRQAGSVRGARVGLSHHFAAMHVFAPPAVRLPLDEMRAWLRERLAQDFGAEAEAWRLAWQDVPPGRPVPVATLAAERFEAVKACLGGAGATLAHLGPWFTSAWARHHRALGSGAAWLALAEPGRLALARVVNGRPVQLAMSRLEEDPAMSVPVQMAAAVARQALRLGVPAQGDVWCLAPDMPVDLAMPGSTLRFRALDGSGAGWGGLLS